MKKLLENFSKVAIGFVMAVFSAVLSAVPFERMLFDSSNAQNSNKYWSTVLMLNQWVRLKNQNKSLSEYFVEKGYKKIAIYGMAHTGLVFQEEMDDSEIEILYGIDRNADSIYSDIKVKKPSEDLDAVDAIVVTPVYYFESIKKDLENKVHCPIISLEEVVYYI